MKLCLAILFFCIINLIFIGVSFAQETISSSEFFLKEMTGAIHSITYDNDGNMVVGSLGDNNSVGVEGVKRIYKITPDKQVTTINSLKCTFITALRYDSKDNLYIVYFSNANNVWKLGKFSNQVFSDICNLEEETGEIKIDVNDNVYAGSIVYYSTTGKVEKADFMDAPADDDFNHYYKNTFGGKTLVRHTKTGDNNSRIDTILSGRSFLKEYTCDKSGIVYMLEYENNNDYILKINPGSVTEKIKIDVSPTYRQGIIREGFITKIILGNEKFGKNYAFITDWSGDIIKVNLSVFVSLNDIKYKSSLTIYPNPARNFTTLRFFQPKAGNAMVKVFNTNGHNVDNIYCIAKSGENQITLSSKEMPHGLYYIQLCTEGHAETKKIFFY